MIPLTFRKSILFYIALMMVINLSLKLLLSGLDFQSLDLHLCAKIITRAILIGVSIALIKYHKIIVKNLNPIFHSILIALILYFSFYQMMSIVGQSISVYENGLFLVMCLAVGCFEELFFRVFIFNMIRKSAIINYRDIVLTSLIFGVVHFTNYFTQDTYFLSILNQVVFAFGVGVIFQAIYLRFQNISLCITFHGIINYFGSYRNELLEFDVSNSALEGGYSWTTFFSTLGVFVFLFIVLILPISYLLIESAKAKQISMS